MVSSRGTPANVTRACHYNVCANKKSWILNSIFNSIKFI